MKPRIHSLLSAHPDDLRRWLTEPGARGAVWCGLTAFLGAGVYGFTIGLWRAPLQAIYTGLKFPLLVALTGTGNALLNGMLAQVFGSGISFRQTALAILMSFAITGLILGALAPVSLFILYNTPALASGAMLLGHSVTLITHVLFIAGAGMIADMVDDCVKGGDGVWRYARRDFVPLYFGEAELTVAPEKLTASKTDPV